MARNLQIPLLLLFAIFLHSYLTSGLTTKLQRRAEAQPESITTALSFSSSESDIDALIESIELGPDLDLSHPKYASLVDSIMKNNYEPPSSRNRTASELSPSIGPQAKRAGPRWGEIECRTTDSSGADYDAAMKLWSASITIFQGKFCSQNKKPPFWSGSACTRLLKWGMEAEFEICGSYAWFDDWRVYCEDLVVPFKGLVETCRKGGLVVGKQGLWPTGSGPGSKPHNQIWVDRPKDVGIWN